MVYQVPASKASIKQNQFRFQVPGDKRTYSLPKMQFLPVGVVSEASKLAEPTLFDFLTFFGNGPAAKAVKGLDKDQLSHLTDAWMKDSGVKLGESSASSGS